MHNISYKDGKVEAELLQIVNIHRPFHSRVDRVSQKASLNKLITSPDETRNSPQIKRFLVSSGNRYAYKMHASYKDHIKCHSIYETNSSVSRILTSSVISTLIDQVDNFPNLKKDLIKVVKTVVDSWDFDCIITDIPWFKGKFDVPVLVPNWKLVKYDDGLPLSTSVSLLLNKYKNIPINILPFECFKELPTNYTNIENVKYKCPLVILKCNSYCAGYIVNTLNKGLPSTIFKISGVLT